MSRDEWLNWITDKRSTIHLIGIKDQDFLRHTNYRAHHHI